MLLLRLQRNKPIIAKKWRRLIQYQTPVAILPVLMMS